MGIDKLGECIYKYGADAAREIDGFKFLAVPTALSVFLFKVIVVVDQKTTASGATTLARRRSPQEQLAEHVEVERTVHVFCSPKGN